MCVQATARERVGREVGARGGGGLPLSCGPDPVTAIVHRREDHAGPFLVLHTCPAIHFCIFGSLPVCCGAEVFPRAGSNGGE